MLLLSSRPQRRSLVRLSPLIALAAVVLGLVIAVQTAQAAAPILGPQVRIGPPTWTPWQLNPVLSEHGQAAVIAVSPPPSHGLPSSAVPPLYIWLAANHRVRPTGVRGDPLAVTDDGKAIAYQCGPGANQGASAHVQLCFWHSSASHVRQISLQPFCPDRQDHVAGATQMVLSADWHTLMIWCIHGNYSSASAVVLLHLGAGAPKTIAVLHRMATEEADLSPDGSTALMNEYPANGNFIYRSGHLHRVVNHHGVGIFSRNGQFVDYFGYATSASSFGDDVVIENVETRAASHIPFQDLPVDECGGCLTLRPGSVSDDGRRVFFGISGANNGTNGLYVADQPSGSVVELDNKVCHGTASGGCTGPIRAEIAWHGVSADGHVVLYKVEGPATTDPEVGLFERTVG